MTVLIALAARARTARPSLTAALRDGLGDRYPQTGRPSRTRIPLIRVLLLPLISYRPDVRRFRNIRYGDAGRGQLLDVYAKAPPFLIIHGVLDTLVLVDDARHFADGLASASDQPVVFAELPGTQHNFDLFHSVRNHAVTDAVESFLTCVHART